MFVLSCLLLMIITKYLAADSLTGTNPLYPCLVISMFHILPYMHILYGISGLD